VEHFARALPVLERAEYPLEEIVSHRLPLERLSDAMEALTTSYRLDGREAVKIAIAPND
jgi:L-iditol 2-dehydrogenase